MAKSEELRGLHENMILNETSKNQEKLLQFVTKQVIADIVNKYNVEISYEKQLKISDIVAFLRKNFPSVSFADPDSDKSYISPDGGILYIVDTKGNKFPILIGEVKDQGTNDRRAAENKKKQAKGNAVERLGKNVIGFRTFMLTEGIFPFVCFGSGCDFEEGSTIRDRVLTIAIFGELNKNHTVNELSGTTVFNRGSYYFRDKEWSQEEMYEILYDVAERSLYYYFSKYGKETFVRRSDSSFDPPQNNSAGLWYLFFKNVISKKYSSKYICNVEFSDDYGSAYFQMQPKNIKDISIVYRVDSAKCINNSFDSQILILKYSDFEKIEMIIKDLADTCSYFNLKKKLPKNCVFAKVKNTNKIKKEIDANTFAINLDVTLKEYNTIIRSF